MNLPTSRVEPPGWSHTQGDSDAGAVSGGQGTLLGHVLGLPSQVVETFWDSRQPHVFAEELALVDCATPKRRNDFLTGRQCAHAALSALGVRPAPLLRDGAGAPVWPAGVVGSITHSRGYRAAAVAPRAEIAAIGVDAEPNERMSSGVLEAVGAPVELSAVKLMRGSDVALDRLLLSAKESVFKAMYSMTSTPTLVRESVILLAADGSFTVYAAAERERGELMRNISGRWIAAGGMLATAALIPACAAPWAVPDGECSGPG